MLSDHYNEQVDIKRQTEQLDHYGDPDGSGILEYTAHLSDVDCEIQPLEDNITQDITVGFGKDMLMFCDIIDVIESDRVIRADGTEYRIVGIERYDEFRGIAQHLELRIRAFES